MAKKESGSERKARRRRGTDLSVENLGGGGGTDLSVENLGGGGDSASAVENLGVGESGPPVGSSVQAGPPVGTPVENPGGGGGDSASAVENLGVGESGPPVGSSVQAGPPVGTSVENPGGGGGGSASAVENLGGGGDSASAVENLGVGESGPPVGSSVQAGPPVGTPVANPGGGGSASAVENLGGGGGGSASAVENLGDGESGPPVGSSVQAGPPVGTPVENPGGGGGDSALAVENLGVGESGPPVGSSVQAGPPVETPVENPGGGGGSASAVENLGGGGDSASAVENLGVGESGPPVGSSVQAGPPVGTPVENPGGGGSASAVENLGRTACGGGVTEKPAENLGSTTEKRRNLSAPSGEETESHGIPERRETQPRTRHTGGNQYVAAGHHHFKGLMDEQGRYITPPPMGKPYEYRQRGTGVVESPMKFDPPTFDVDIATPRYRRDLTPYPSLGRQTQLSRTRTAHDLTQGVQELQTNQLWFQGDWRSEGQQRREAEHRAMREEALQLRDVADRATLRANHIEVMAIRSERHLILQAENDRRAGQNRAQARSEMKMEVLENEAGRRRVEGNPGRLGARREGAITDEEYYALCRRLQTLGAQMVQAEIRKDAMMAEAARDTPGNGIVIPWEMDSPAQETPQEPGSLNLNTKPKGESVQVIDEEEMPELTSGEESDGQRPGPATEEKTDGVLIDLSCPSETPSPVTMTEPDQEDEDPMEGLEAFFMSQLAEPEKEEPSQQEEDPRRKAQKLRASQLSELAGGSVSNKGMFPWMRRRRSYGIS